MTPEWRSYDSVAAIHDSLAVPIVFLRPAQDLLARMDAPSARAILDVGTGTGVAALLASQAVAPTGIVVALDLSVPMLRAARDHGLPCVVAGTVPHLPFANATFDRVLASFVLSHLRSYKASLADMVRTLKPGGRIGATAWGPMENEFREYWRSLADPLIGKEELRAALQEALPWEEWFSDPASLREAFQEAGLSDVAVETKQYVNRMSIPDFLSLREMSMQARFIRQTTDAGAWQRFRKTASEEFRSRFKEPIDDVRDVHIAIGSRS